ncbi:MAG: nucleotidyl transferase AbiEii/AbiGii toxin family protein [bacterium]
MIRVYPPETVVAEKYEAMVTLGIANTRMKDFYDLFTLSEAHAFDGGTLSAAIANTFARRGTPLPIEQPIALTPAFGAGTDKARQWRAFLMRSRLTQVAALPQIVEQIGSFIWTASQAARSRRANRAVWLPGIGWTDG